ncbi:hypothetical protein [Clostridium estertheticum]|uniref:hypothetical protein n=1 Tax=Clostridium estertheticum TaxID=238834 RepID=UPI001CF46143|nr:hypothetical protein [Clostridium estertheticum]MCB2361686.1 hypothetical protein [Clostridium estertheticum]
MQWPKIIFILLGILVIIIFKYLPVKFVLPNKSKYRVIYETSYINSYRIGGYCLGVYFILFGVILMFMNGWPHGVGIFAPIPPLIATISLRNQKKYIEKVC